MLLNLMLKFQSKKKTFDRYMLLNEDIMSIVTDIESLRMNADNNKKIKKSLKNLEKTKINLEKELVLIEETFYDIEKGLWVGVAYDLEDVDAEPILLYIPFHKVHNHMEVFGTSGYGKSRLMAIIMRQFIHYDWSLFAIDPKGGEFQEVAAWIYEFAAEVGMQKNVMRIMPTEPSLSDKANPIFGMNDVEIASLGASLTVSGSGTMTTQEQFFSGQVYKTLYAILTSMTYLENAISPDRSIVNNRVIREVQKYINFTQNKGVENFYEEENIEYPDVATISLEDNKKIEIKHAISPFNRELVTFRELAYYSTFENLEELIKILDGTPIPIIDDNKKREHEISLMKQLARKNLEDIIQKGRDFYDKTGTSLNLLLSQLAYGPVGEVLCDIRINPLVKKARDKEGMIVLLQPAPMKFEKVSEILIKIYTRMWLSLFGTIGASGRGLTKRVAMVIDEAKPMMFPGIEEIYNKARQLGMTIVALYQSKSDLKFKLGETLADIVQDNTATSITMKQVSMSSRAEMAASFGTIKVAENIQMTEMDGGGRSTIIYNEKELVSPDDINTLEIGEGFLQHGGKKYFVKFPYQKDPIPVNIVMPKLQEEESYEFIEQAESYLISTAKEVEDKNREEEQKKIRKHS